MKKRSSFYTADEQFNEYEIFLVRNLKTGTNWHNPGHQDSIPKTGTVSAKPGQLECLCLGVPQRSVNIKKF